MTFDETVAFLSTQVGQTIDVSVGLERPGHADPVGVVGFSGRIVDLRRSTGTSDPDSWYVWADWDGPPSPGPRFLKLTRDLVVSAGVMAEVTDAEERSDAGVIWLVTIRQTPLVMTVEIYR